MRRLLLVIAAAGLLAAPACSKRKAKGGSVKVDGSSTVFLISAAVAEQFKKVAGGDASVGASGTGGGFKKFCAGDTDVSGASRPIKPSEVEACQKHGVEWIELPVAYDGIAVVVSKHNDWVDHLTVEELAKMWAPEAQGKITSWSQIRDGWPDRKLTLFGPGVDSGTYDYFTQATVGKEHSSRGDYTQSEDDNTLVTGVAMDDNALAFFGYAYYVENTDKLKLVPIDDGNPGNGDGPIPPSPQAIVDGTYQPLSRPIFIYVSVAATKKPHVEKFVNFYLEHAKELSAKVGYVPLPDKVYELARTRYAERKTGSVFGGKGATVGVTLESLLAHEGG